MGKMSWVPIIELERCRAGGGTFVACGGRELAVFRLAEPDRLYVIDNTCPHAGGNLAAGQVAGEVVSCPWHGWKFDLTTGVCVDSPQACVRRYPAEVREGVVYVRTEPSP